MPRKHRAIEGVGASSILTDYNYAQHLEVNKKISANDSFSNNNSGVDARAFKDKLELKAVQDGSASYAALEKKAELYNKLVRGELPDEEDEEKYCLDFFRKDLEHDESHMSQENDTSTPQAQSADGGDDDDDDNFLLNGTKPAGLGQIFAAVDMSHHKHFVMYPIRMMRDMKCFEWLFVCSLISLLGSPSYSYVNVINNKVLLVGEELFKETMPLQNGARLYHLQGLKPQMWYEVKISYPASIPASFSLQLKRGLSDVGLNPGRKLLNTEKIIFKTDGITSLIEQGDMSVLVNVEPEGVVAILGKWEREYIMFNTVCDELMLGIPHEAWYVVVLVLLCLVLAFVVHSHICSFLLPKNGRQSLFDHTVTKST